MRVIISDGAFKHVESELYAYPETKREIERIRDQIMYSRKGDINASIRGSTGDPTGSVATALVSNRTLDHLERVKSVIDDVMDALPDEKKQVINLWYWSRPRRLSWDGIADRLEISRRTALNWRKDIVHAIAIKMGWR